MARKTEEQKQQEQAYKNNLYQTEILEQLLELSEGKNKRIRPVKSTKPTLFIAGKRADQANFLAAAGAFYGQKSYDMFAKEFKKEHEKEKKEKAKKKKEVQTNEKVERLEKKEKERTNKTLKNIEKNTEETAKATEENLSKEEKARLQIKKEAIKARRAAEKKQLEREKAEEERERQKERYNKTFFGQIESSLDKFMEDGGPTGAAIRSVSDNLGVIGEMIKTDYEAKLEEKKERQKQLEMERKEKEKEMTFLKANFFETLQKIEEKDEKERSALENHLIKKVSDLGDNIGELSETQMSWFLDRLKDEKIVQEKFLDEFGESLNVALREGQKDEKYKEFFEKYIKDEEKLKDQVDDGFKDNGKLLETIIENQEKALKQTQEINDQQTRNVKDEKTEAKIQQIKKEKVEEQNRKETLSIWGKILGALSGLSEKFGGFGKKLSGMFSKGDDDGGWLSGLIGGAISLFGGKILGKFKSVLRPLLALGAGGGILSKVGGWLGLTDDAAKVVKGGTVKPVPKASSSSVKKWSASPDLKPNAKVSPKKGGFGSKILKKLSSEAGEKAGEKAAGKAIGKGVAKAGAKSLIKKIPILGAVAGAGFAVERALKGDWLGAGGELLSGIASIFPGVGTGISVAIDAGLMARDVAKADEKKTKKAIEKSEKSIKKSKFGKVGKVAKYGLLAGAAYWAYDALFGETEEEKIKKEQEELRKKYEKKKKERAILDEASNKIILKQAKENAKLHKQDKERLNKMLSASLPSVASKPSKLSSASDSERIRRMIEENKASIKQQKKESEVKSKLGTSAILEVTKSGAIIQTSGKLENKLNLEKTQLEILRVLKRIAFGEEVESSKERTSKSIKEIKKRSKEAKKEKEKKLKAIRQKDKEQKEKSLWQRIKDGASSIWDSTKSFFGFGGSSASSGGGGGGGSYGGGAPGFSGGTYSAPTPYNGPAPDGTMKSLLDRIAQGEGTKNNYDTTFAYGKYDPYKKPLTQMTLGEVKQFQAGMLRRGSPSTAVGRYQFLRKTLSEVQAQMKLPDSTIFDAKTQDAMILHRLKKTRGLDAWLNGRMSDQDFQLKLSQEFASIANPYTGRSYYGQPVGTTTAEMQAVLQAIKQNGGASTAIASSGSSGGSSSVASIGSSTGPIGGSSGGSSSVASIGSSTGPIGGGSEQVMKPVSGNYASSSIPSPSFGSSPSPGSQSNGNSTGPIGGVRQNFGKGLGVKQLNPSVFPNILQGNTSFLPPNLGSGVVNISGAMNSIFANLARGTFNPGMIPGMLNNPMMNEMNSVLNRVISAKGMMNSALMNLPNSIGGVVGQATSQAIHQIIPTETQPYESNLAGDAMLSALRSVFLAKS